MDVEGHHNSPVSQVMLPRPDDIGVRAKTAAGLFPGLQVVVRGLEVLADRFRGIKHRVEGAA